MKEENYRLWDWQRLLIGDNPWGFIFEVLGRTLVIYLCLMVVMRLLGKRMNAQLTIMDLAVMLTLGAIASVPMQAFNRGILPGVILLISILLLHQVSTLTIYKKRKVEVLSQGKISLLIKNGVLDPEKLNNLRISKDQLFSVLRKKGVRHLGEVKRLYSEADGHFSLYKAKEPKPGLSVLPRSEEALPEKQNTVLNHLVCAYCGYAVLQADHFDKPCSNCGNEDWIHATYTKEQKI